MTTPQGPSHEDPSIWARPGGQDPSAQPETPVEAPTTQMPAGHGEPQADRPHEPPAPPDQAAIPPTAQDYPAGLPYDQPPSEDVPAPVKTKRRLDRLSIVLVLVIVVALLAAGLVGAELYARHRADKVVADAAECVVQDKVSVSFGPTPFLLQHLRGDYHGISIRTAGNQLRSAKGMRADINIDDVDLHGNADSKGTIGALDATITWTSGGIKETVQHAVPFVGGLVNDVATNPGAGTIELSGALGLGSVTVKPQIAENGLSLQVVKVTAMGATVPHETAQSALDVFTSSLTNDYPLGIHADSVQVTNDGVVAHYSTRNASIPSAQADPCFAKL
ncbi:MAG: LmeA family phospholipid-binding protein [Mycobacterium sp.]